MERAVPQVRISSKQAVEMTPAVSTRPVRVAFLTPVPGGAGGWAEGGAEQGSQEGDQPRCHSSKMSVPTLSFALFCKYLWNYY